MPAVPRRHRHRGIDRIEFVAHEDFDAAVGQHPAGNGCGLPFGELELGVLEVGNGSSECFALGGGAAASQGKITKR